MAGVGRAAAVMAAGALLLAEAATGGGSSAAGGVGSRCTSWAPRSAMTAFVAAYNAGDRRRLDALFAARPRFRWYSSAAPGPRLRARATRRDTLLPYFRARHRHHDRLRLVWFRFTGNSNGYGHFAFVLRRSAADFRHGASFGLVGKGAAVCTGAALEQRVRFVVISLGAPGSNRR
jgi:hypothetical protein